MRNKGIRRLSCGVKFYFLSCIFLLLAARLASAAPSTILIQGKLTGTGGKALSGTRVYQVQFYDAYSGGNALGTLMTGTVSVAASGRFTIELTPPAEVLKAAGPVYYSLALDSADPPDGKIDPGDIFPNRVKMTSVLFAQKLARMGSGSGVDADMLDGAHSKTFVTTSSLNVQLAGKASLTHTHMLQSLGGAVTDAQVPDNITINFAKTAGLATSATLALRALNADRATTASKAFWAAISDEATTAVVSLRAKNADRATNADQATTASKAFWAAFSDEATTAVMSLRTKNADHATNADQATSASKAFWAAFSDEATSAGLSQRAMNADHATDADHATNSDHATNADRATSATRALNSDHTTTASWSDNSGRLGNIAAKDYLTTAAAMTLLAGKANLVHTHNLQDLGGAVTDAQVPDTITINLAKTAGTATTATLALRALNADWATSAGSAVNANTVDGFHGAALADTLDSAAARGATTSRALSLTNPTDSAGPALGALVVAGGVGIGKQLNVGGDVTITGNLTYAGGNKPFAWQVVAANTTAMANTGYIANPPTGSLTVTLPNLPPVGSIVGVSSISESGWRIAQLAGQKILLDGMNLPVDSWTPRDSVRGWYGIAMSANGTRLAAVDFSGSGGSGGLIYISSDSGATWTPKATNQNWTGVAMSSDGTKLAACVQGGQIYVSSDSGATWAARDSNRGWTAIAMSADGTRLVACDFSGAEGTGGQLYISTNSGLTWTPKDSNRNWTAVAMSADGTRMAACDYFGGAGLGGKVYTSADSGLTWTPRDSDRNWSAVAMSADGNHLAACDFSGAEGSGGQIYISNDGGVSWVPRAGNLNWYAITMADDGKRLAAAVNGGQIYTSTDGGLCWTPRATSDQWSAIAMDADGSRIAACVINGQIETSIQFAQETTTGVLGFLAGVGHSSIQLLHVGQNQFVPLSFAGNFNWQ